MRPHTSSVALVLSVLVAWTVAGAQEDTVPSIAMLASMKTMPTVWPIGALSPDGSSLAYAVRVPMNSASEALVDYTPTGMSAANGHGTDLWLADTRTGQSERITDGKGLVEEPVWSPDGGRLAFYSDRDGKARLWVWETRTRTLRRVSDAVVHPSQYYEARLRWTPDGHSLLALLAPDADEAAGASVQSTAKPASTDAAISSGASVRVYRAHEKRETERPAAGGLDAVTLDTTERYHWMFADLALVRLTDGAVRRLAHRKALLWYDVSPDGNWVAMVRPTGRYPGMEQVVHDVEIVPTAGGDARVAVGQGRIEWGAATWSPDSKRIAWITNGAMADGDVHIIDVATARDSTLTRAPHPRLGADRPWRAYWSPDGQTLYFASYQHGLRNEVREGGLWKASLGSDRLVRVTPETWNREILHIVSDATNNHIWTRDGGRTLLVTTRDPETKAAGFYRIDSATGAATRLHERDEYHPSPYFRAPLGPLTSADRSTIVYLAEDARNSPNLWVARTDDLQPRPITNINPELSRLKLGPSRVIDFLGPAGQRLQASLVLPADYRPDVRYPTIVYVYPGAYVHSNQVNQFRLAPTGMCGLNNEQILASRGYAVLMPEIPQNRGTPMKDLVEGVQHAVNRVIELGIADPDRLGICGYSYGGYSTIAVITQTTRFKGAVMGTGQGDLLAHYLGFSPATASDGVSWAEGGQGLMGGTPWQYPERYRENSPITYLDRVRTPLLIAHGDDDRAVALSDQIFVGLRRLGREVEYRRYADEGHLISRRENVTDYWNAVIRWFDRYAKQAAAM